MKLIGMRVFLVCLISTGYVGCVTRIPYAEPNNGPTAKLSLVGGDGAVAAHVQMQADTNCQVLKLMGTLSRTKPVVSFAFNPIVTEKTIDIPVEGPIRIQGYDIRGGTEITTCKAAIQFNPRSGGEYKMIWSFDRSTCNMELLQKTQAGKWALEPNVQTIKFCGY